MEKKIKANEAIGASEVILVDEEGKSLGKTPLSKAIEIAKSKNLDVVEVAANSNPPVAKLINLGKFQYQQEKRLRKQKKHKVGELKEIRLGLKTSEHDQEIKINQAKRFLVKQYKVRINLRLVGREMMFIDKAFILIERAIKSLSEFGNPEEKPKKERNIISVTINPR